MTRAPSPGRTNIDPTKYQMNTVPAEVVARLAQLKNQGLPEEALRPPPLFDRRPIIGRLRRIGVWAQRHKTPFVIAAIAGMFLLGGTVRLFLKPPRIPPAAQRTSQAAVDSPKPVLEDSHGVNLGDALAQPARPAPADAAAATTAKPPTTPRSAVGSAPAPQVVPAPNVPHGRQAAPVQPQRAKRTASKTSKGDDDELFMKD